MRDKPTTRRPRGFTNGPRADRLMSLVLHHGQVWAARDDGARWIVHQIHRDDLQVTIRHASRARRQTITYRQMLAGYGLVFLDETEVTQ